VAQIALGLTSKIFVGNLNAERDWGHAKDYVDAMWRMLQQSEPDDFVIATGTKTSVRDFCKMAFAAAGIEIAFKGTGESETAVVEKVADADSAVKPGQAVVQIDPRYYRPTEVDLLLGDPTKARKKLGWEPRHTLQELVDEMVNADLKLFGKEVLLKKEGYKVFRAAES